MIRVLQVLGGTNLGGAESRIMDIYRHMDRSRIQFDFLVTEGNSGYFTPEIESLGGHVYTIPRYRIYNHMQYVAGVKAFFEQHHDYMAVHGHMTSTAAIYLPIAKAAGIPQRRAITVAPPAISREFSRYLGIPRPIMYFRFSKCHSVGKI